MAKAGGVVALVLGIVAGLFGLVLYYSCTATLLGYCFQYGYQSVGFLGMVFGGVLFVVGIVLLALPEKEPTRPVQYYPPPVAYFPPPQPRRQPPAPAQAPPQPSDQKFCPGCGNRYPAEYKVCPRDSTELKTVQ